MQTQKRISTALPMIFLLLFALAFIPTVVRSAGVQLYDEPVNCALQSSRWLSWMNLPCRPEPLSQEESKRYCTGNFSDACNRWRDSQPVLAPAPAPAPTLANTPDFTQSQFNKMYPKPGASKAPAPTPVAGSVRSTGVNSRSAQECSIVAGEPCSTAQLREFSETGQLTYGNSEWSGPVAAPNHANTVNTPFTRETMQWAFDSCNGEDNPDACKAQLTQQFGMTPIGTNPRDESSFGTRFAPAPTIDPLDEGSFGNIFAPAPAPVPVRATEFLPGGIYDNGYQVGMRTGSGADLPPMFKTGWGWFDRVVLQIPDNTTSAPAPQPQQNTPFNSNYGYNIPNSFAPTGQAQSQQDVPVSYAQSSENQQSSPCFTGWLSGLNGGWNNCAGGTSGAEQLPAQVQEGPTTQPPAPVVEYPAQNPGYIPRVVPPLDVPPAQSAPVDYWTPTDIVDQENNPAYEWPNYLERIAPDETQQFNYFGGQIDWGSSYINDEPINWYLMYANPTRQFSQAEQSPQSMQNQSLAASALGALIPDIISAEN